MCWIPQFCTYSQLTWRSALQAKHQPLQFLNVSTLREYLRFEFLQLVGEASEPSLASDLAASNPWHQEQDPPEPAPEDSDRVIAPVISSDSNDGAADATGPDGVTADVGDSDYPNSTSPSLSSAPRPISTGGVKADGQFDFERVLQDFVLLTFLVSPLPLQAPPPPCLTLQLKPMGMHASSPKGTSRPQPDSMLVNPCPM